jgi:hypothetical protein
MLAEPALTWPPVGSVFGAICAAAGFSHADDVSALLTASASKWLVRKNFPYGKESMTERNPGGRSPAGPLLLF